MDGIEATRLIRNIDGEYARNVPIIALTANAVAGNKEIFLENGISDFLAKPIDIQKLDEMLEKWIPREKQLRHSPETPLPNAVAEEAPGALAAIDGLDINVGLANTGNSLRAFRQILRIYTADALDRLPQIQAAVASGDLATYTTMVHALKGISRSIGAEVLGDMAAALEKSGRMKDLAIITEKTGEFITALKTFTGDISAALSETADKTEDTLSAAQLQKLREALLETNTEKVNTLITEYSSFPLEKTIRDLIGSIEQDVLLFEYEDAVEKLDRAM
jgi:HPt (histidine-containing phosphotransfer) domain-containing protein